MLRLSPVNVLDDIISDVDLVLIMSVNPGFGGQSFIQNTYKKVSEVRTLIESNINKPIIEVDGGVNLENAKKLIISGANALVAGNSVFNTSGPSDTILNFKSL